MQVVLQYVVWGAIALLLYTYVLYPVFMVQIARRLSNSASVRAEVNMAADAASLPSVVVIVAAYNEEKHIAARIENLLQQDYPSDRFHSSRKRYSIDSGDTKPTSGSEDGPQAIETVIRHKAEPAATRPTGRRVDLRLTKTAM